MCSGRVSSCCSTCDTRRVTLVTNPVSSHKWGKNRIMITTNETYQLSFFWFQFKTQYLQCSFPAASVVVFSLWYVVCGGSVVVIIQDDRPSIYLFFMTNAHIKMYSWGKLKQVSAIFFLLRELLVIFWLNGTWNK